ncbi:MAG TPA: cation:proton antiporter [Gaiella sp.]|uniref:cation:proton antiporter n=1 Tax=Gaiella sp. TaxID=2663207 RepID=UPI002D80A584|nr:cation:proton antiporter [Gaiella sp.]HET9287189.1 cation:proton antiporter [Gaiella sp.]
MTLAELAVTIAVLGVLGLAASRFGLSAIPAYLFAGILLGPNEPTLISLVQPTEVTAFVAEIGLIFLLFFLGLEFSVERLVRSGRHVGLGGAADVAINAGLGLLVGLAAFGPSFAALVVAACVYVSSSAIAVKALIDFRRLADDETDLVLAILLFEDIAIAAVLGFVATGGGTVGTTSWVATKALLFVAASLAASRWLGGPIGRLLGRLELEFFLLAVFGFVIGMSAIAKELEMSEAVGALMAGVILSDSGVRSEIEQRFFSVRDVFAALFFFTFALTIDLGRIPDVGWIVLLALVATVVGKVGVGVIAGRLGGFTARQGINAGAALVAHGEFTIILAQLAAGNAALSLAQRDEIVAFAGIYVLASATIGLLVMKESKRLGRILRPASVLE